MYIKTNGTQLKNNGVELVGAEKLMLRLDMISSWGK